MTDLSKRFELVKIDVDSEIQKEMDELFEKRNAIIKAATKELNEIIDKAFIQAMRTEVKPPIKGKIRKWKLWFRGIAKCVDENGTIWFQQRGRQITPKFEMPTFKVGE